MTPTACLLVLKLQIGTGQKDSMASGMHSHRFVVFSLNMHIELLGCLLWTPSLSLYSCGCSFKCYLLIFPGPPLLRISTWFCLRPLEKTSSLTLEHCILTYPFFSHLSTWSFLLAFKWMQLSFFFSLKTLPWSIVILQVLPYCSAQMSIQKELFILIPCIYSLFIYFQYAFFFYLSPVLTKVPNSK